MPLLGRVPMGGWRTTLALRDGGRCAEWSPSSLAAPTAADLVDRPLAQRVGMAYRRRADSSGLNEVSDSHWNAEVLQTRQDVNLPEGQVLITVT